MPHLCPNEIDSDRRETQKKILARIGWDKFVCQEEIPKVHHRFSHYYLLAQFKWKPYLTLYTQDSFFKHLFNKDCRLECLHTLLFPRHWVECIFTSLHTYWPNGDGLLAAWLITCASLTYVLIRKVFYKFLGIIKSFHLNNQFSILIHNFIYVYY